jgi:undecaprenyl-diphosphatase
VDTVFGYRGGLYGFISSHAANAFGLATLTVFIFRNRLFTAVILVYAFLTGYSRIYLGVHFISDIAAGALVGVLLGYAVYQLYNLSRIYFLKTDREDLKKPLYSKQSVYLICFVYVIYIVILLLFNNQLISLFDKH